MFGGYLKESILTQFVLVHIIQMNAEQREIVTVFVHSISYLC